MPLLTQKELNDKNLFKLLKKSVKKTISEKGIDPNTKKGNKELDYLLKKITAFHFNSFEQVQIKGEKIGDLIVKLSNERGKIALDRGIIQHILLKEDLTTLGEDPTVSSKANLTTELPAKPISSTPGTQDKADEEAQINLPHPVQVEVKESLSTAVTEKEKKEFVQAAETVTPPNQDTTSISLKEQIGEDIKTAMKAQDKIRLETVRGIKKVLIEKEVSLRPSGQENLTPEQEIEVLTQQAKQRRDSIEQYTNAGREDLANKEAQELAIIETYLPKQLTNEELTQIIDEIITSVGATSSKDLGKVMGVAMKQLKGKADGKKIQELVKNQLN